MDKVWEEFKEDHADLWVFAYGSLLWNPGFKIVESIPSVLQGYRRSFCMWSIHYRGTPEKPGLVLALEQHEGEQCRGLALRCQKEDKKKVLTYLRARELISSAYIERTTRINFNDGRTPIALLYVVDTNHPQYTGELSLERQAGIISHARGQVGDNCDYLNRTVQRLNQLGLTDSSLENLNQLVQTRLGDSKDGK